MNTVDSKFEFEQNESFDLIIKLYYYIKKSVLLYVMILSFDLGLKNMGACALDDTTLNIIAWDVLETSQRTEDIVTTLDTWITCLKCEKEINENVSVSVLLERQPWKNNRTRRLYIIMETYFRIVFPSYKVRGVMSNHKWHRLGRCVPKTYTERKKEIVNVCKTELQNSQSRTNDEWYEWFMNQPKKDDLADAYVQAICSINRSNLPIANNEV